MSPIVDVHVHVYPPELIRDQEAISAREPHFDLLTHNRVHRWGSADELIAQMDRDGIAQSWIFGFAFRDLGLCRLCNDYVIDAVRRYPGRLLGLAVVPPLARGAMAEIERCRDAGLIGVGELFPQGQGFDLDDFQQTWRLAGTCAESGLVLLIHTAEPVGHQYDGKGNVGPKEAAAFCIHHPEAKVIFAHWGGGLWLYEAMAELRLALSNAWFDTAAWPYLYDSSVLTAAQAVGAGRQILYGSDWPILAKDRFVPLLEGAGVGSQVLVGLLGGNALELLKSLGRGSDGPLL